MNPQLKRIPEQRQYPAQAELTREIHTLMRQALSVAPAAPEDDLVATGILDSLTLIQLLVQIEQRFEVTIPLEELELDEIRSISSLAQLVARYKMTYASASQPV